MRSLLQTGVLLLARTDGEGPDHSASIARGTFSVAWTTEPMTLDYRPSVELDYFIDRDGDGVCDREIDLSGRLWWAEVTDYEAPVFVYSVSPETRGGCGVFRQ